MLQVATGDTLTLSGATIIGTTITNNGNIDVTGSSAIEGELTIFGGDVTVASGVTLTLDDVVLDNVAFTSEQRRHHAEYSDRCRRHADLGGRQLVRAGHRRWRCDHR